MDAVQRMRKKAQDKGNLKSTEQQKVETKTIESNPVIVIEQANPQVVYVPSYDPFLVYGSPIYPYPPIYYPPAGYYAAGMAISFGVGIAMGAFWGGGWGWGCGWGGNNVYINRNNNFNRNTNIGGGNRNNIGGGNRGGNLATALDPTSWRRRSRRQMATQSGTSRRSSLSRPQGQRTDFGERRAVIPSLTGRPVRGNSLVGKVAIWPAIAQAELA